MGRWLNGAQKVRAAMDTAGAALDDAAASRAVPLYPTLQGDGALIRAGTRINWNGTLKRAAVDLWDVPKNAPDSAPDRKSTRLNSSHSGQSRMPSSA